MKKFIITMVTLLTAVTGVKAMGYEQAREQALFLTDKMAYELNLSEQQYEAAYEINLDYLMSVNTVDDLYAEYWIQRNLDMEAIFLDWQWSAFCAASYFYRPLYWDAGVWHFGIYAHYPHRTFYFFPRPAVWATYRGAHSWRHHDGGWWVHHGASFRGPTHHGMRHGSAHHYSANPRPHITHNHSGASIHRGNASSIQHSRPSSTRSTIGHEGARNSAVFRHSGDNSSRSSSGFSHSSGGSRSGGFSSGSHGGGSSHGSFSGGSHGGSHGSFSGGGSRGGFSGSGSHGGGGSHGGFSGGGSHGGRR